MYEYILLPKVLNSYKTVWPEFKSNHHFNLVYLWACCLAKVHRSVNLARLSVEHCPCVCPSVMLSGGCSFMLAGKLEC